MTVASAPRPERPSPRTAFLLTQLGAHAADRFAARVAEIGLTPRDAGALRALGRSPGISQRELAGRLGTVPSRLVALVDDLENRGLVERVRSAKDRRNYELQLTDAGTALLAQLRTVADAHQDGLLKTLDDDERLVLSRLLAKVAAGAGLGPDGHPGYARDESRHD
ncbi:MarR family winged helix-turn-helix transcriptional regulator [Leifsonia poae]|uniref:MarR family winged helix-turn-helix transcriptional regulator n=1 Tax=Leifsonia poae TaxID=110933 RepID=UPI001CBFFD6A|nr:MarR family transcriptional regulator [Leifsonia poae]